MWVGKSFELTRSCRRITFDFKLFAALQLGLDRCFEIMDFVIERLYLGIHGRRMVALHQEF
ncbi:hypothetical protein V2J09_021950 [Rumex salicifolius]